jgi:hypothetical protein
LVFGPYTTTNDPDSGNCGDNWALDNYARTFIVNPESNGGFTVIELFKGTSTTIAGAAQPNPASCPATLTGTAGTGVYETGNVTVPMFGEYVMSIPAGADFNPYASFSLPSSDTGVAGTNAWLATFFAGYGSDSTPSLSSLTYAWEFYYGSGTNTWADTDHGSSQGNIVG